MQKRYLSLIFVLVIATICIVIGIISRQPAPANPVKILMPNSGGRVVFNHREHTEDYKIDCNICHHENRSDRPDPKACGTCHGVEFNAEFASTHRETFANDPQACLTCHHVEYTGSYWDRNMHDLHAENYAENCQTCHHDVDIEPEPENCAACHEPIQKGKPIPISAEMPNFRDAVHTKCANADCHVHAEVFEKNLKGCSYCHLGVMPIDEFVKSKKTALSQKEQDSLSNCAVCHYAPEAEELMLGRMQAFHQQCGNCHDKYKLGPSVNQEKEQCNQCHIR